MTTEGHILLLLLSLAIMAALDKQRDGLGWMGFLMALGVFLYCLLNLPLHQLAVP